MKNNSMGLITFGMVIYLLLLLISSISIVVDAFTYHNPTIIKIIPKTTTTTATKTKTTTTIQSLASLYYQQQQQYKNQRPLKQKIIIRQLSSSLSSSSSSVEGNYDPDEIEKTKEQIAKGSIGARIKALYKFTRPHTIRGTILGSLAGTTRALLDTPNRFTGISFATLIPQALLGVLALLLGNAFIVGINQIYDKDIDKVNKPFLPVASGEMSKRMAWITIVASAIAGPILVYQNFPLLLFQLYVFGLSLGVTYSVPPFRWKSNPILAAASIACVRGFLLNFGVYYGVITALGKSVFTWSPKVTFIARFMSAFALIIAITKDLPDIKGDQAYKINTLATQLGVKKLATLATIGLGCNYIHAILTGLVLYPIGTFRFVPMIGGHLALASLLVYRFQQLQPNSLPSVKLYYKHIWDLFYLEYILYTLI